MKKTSINKKLIYWTCNECGETLQGIIDQDGDFISDKELCQPVHFRTIGCYICGCCDGIIGDPIDDDYDDDKE